jgi:DNA-directed RNA polymerase specialized sigma24 family protein
MLYNVCQEERAPPASPLTPEEAKAKVLDHWNQLDAMARRRFPKDQNLAHEGLLYVLKHLEAEDWRRVRTWQGLGQFLPFLSMLAARLLMDFSRARFGYIRRPAWLAEKQDPLWDTAYRLLVVERWSRHEAIEQLLLGSTERERWFIGEVVSTIRTRCSDQALPAAQPADTGLGQADEGGGPDSELMIQDKEMLEALQCYLQGEGDPDASVNLRVSELLARLRALLDLTEEDRLLLRLRYRDGLTIPAIVRLLHLEGDPYKRINKLIAQLRKACQRAGYTRESA